MTVSVFSVNAIRFGSLSDRKRVDARNAKLAISWGCSRMRSSKLVISGECSRFELYVFNFGMCLSDWSECERKNLFLLVLK